MGRGQEMPTTVAGLLTRNLPKDPLRAAAYTTVERDAYKIFCCQFRASTGFSATGAVGLTLGKESHTPSAYVVTTLPDTAETFPATTVGFDVNNSKYVYITYVGHAADDCIDVRHATDVYHSDN